MAVSLAYSAQVSVTETLDLTPTGLSQTITHNTYNSSQNLSATTSVPCTKVAGGLATLSGGALTLDLTTVTGVEGITRNMTGLKVQCFKFKNKSTNAGTMTVTFGAANPYLLAGSGWKMILQPGQEFTFFGNEATPDVAAGAKNIDIAGTGTEAGEYIVVCG